MHGTALPFAAASSRVRSISHGTTLSHRHAVHTIIRPVPTACGGSQERGSAPRAHCVRCVPRSGAHGPALTGCSLRGPLTSSLSLGDEDFEQTIVKDLPVEANQRLVDHVVGLHDARSSGQRRSQRGEARRAREAVHLRWLVLGWAGLAWGWAGGRRRQGGGGEEEEPRAASVQPRRRGRAEQRQERQAAPQQLEESAGIASVSVMEGAAPPPLIGPRRASCISAGA